MQWGETEESRGVVERDFRLEVDGRAVPGILWRAASAGAGAPLVLVGHGGSLHKRGCSRATTASPRLRSTPRATASAPRRR
jgi:poly(3-hydroxybutyrate) depolymerase